MRFFRLLIIGSAVFRLTACRHENTLFEEISSSHSGITFNNKITENDSINPMDVVNIYNGGGVGVGDFNNDGLQDIYFGGNMVPGKLYLNKGNFKFEDITAKAGVSGMGRWERGISIVDINNDGLMDIYICNTINKDSLKRRNILYVNQGLDKDGIPHFKDMAAEYGLDIHVQSTMAAFFDYDNDGDLDMYLTVNEASTGTNPSDFIHRKNSTSVPSIGRLYRNDMDQSLHHPVYHDVSQQAGITLEGFGHAATICDINYDGWKDIYVSDDFLSNNILYINNHDGTFTDRTKEYFKHTSFNAMGQDVIDINNDGLADVVELDMNPEDNYRKKMMLGANSTYTYQNFDAYGYQYQYVRNTLQLNQGPSLGARDSILQPAFSEIGLMSGMAQTDWSWCPLITDFDNDSYRDLIITNGFPRDVSDHDFIAYRDKTYGLTSSMDMLKEIPEIKLHNYAFHNNGDLTFLNVTNDWGLTKPTFSNGAAYADFNNDGAMDMVINNINDEVLLYQNHARDKDTITNHFLQIKFKGNDQNINGIGAIASIFYDKGKTQVYENNPYRGYLSTIQCIAHFGLGKTSIVDSIVVKWYNGKEEIIKNIKGDQKLTVDIKNANEPISSGHPHVDSSSLFTNVNDFFGINYKHRDVNFIDFNIQSTLPHKFSEYAPALACGDINGDGLDDLVIGGTSFNPAQIFIQKKDGKFIQKDLTKRNFEEKFKDEGLLLFDANADGKLDLYITSGGYQNAPGSPFYQDRLYINDGKGNFTLDSSALPKNYTSKLCVRAFDYNNDGKMDLFVSGRVDPWHYPREVNSFIFRNDSKDGVAKFTDVTNDVAPSLKNIGMVCDALFTDFDNDGQTDLILTGEWMPVTFLKNKNGKFINVTNNTGLGKYYGWWNSIVAGDFRHTGRMDYIVGNLGLNNIFNASDSFPVQITSNDFDGNGTYDAITSLFLPDKDGVRQEFPLFGRDDMFKQLISLKKKFPDYKSYAIATMQNILSPDQFNNSLRLKANYLQSAYLRNEGNGKFTIIALPKEAQVSVLNGMVVEDFDGDGNLDIAMNGNDYGTEVSIGRYDALNGLVLKGDGKGNFKPLSILQSGIYIPGNGKAMVNLLDNKGDLMLAASQNKEALKVYKLRRQVRQIPILVDDLNAMITFKNGAKEKKEFYFGSSFLSQSSRFLLVDSSMKSIIITGSSGKARTVTIN